ncbi:MAG: IS110 family transposase [Nitrospira sp.]
MRFAGIDIAAERHVVALLDEHEQILVPPTPFGEDVSGYALLQDRLGCPSDLLIVIEATGHYWQNLFAFLTARGFAVTVLNPLRSHRFAAEDLARTKTDAIDAVGLARLAVQKRPAPMPVPDTLVRELREWVRLRDRLLQEQGDRVRQLHRLVDLGFPEFTRLVPHLADPLATTLLHAYPTAQAFATVSVRCLAGLRYGERRRVGASLAQQLIETATRSVGQHHGAAYHVQIRYLCEDLDRLRQRLHSVAQDIERGLTQHEVGTLLTTIEGIGPQTAARLIGELGDPAAFRSAAALAAYVGVIPALRQSGKRQVRRAGLTPLGHARLRAALWMPTLSAVRFNPWLKAFYERLRTRGKLAKVALIAAMHKLLAAIYSVAKHRRPFVIHAAPQGVRSQ